MPVSRRGDVAEESAVRYQETRSIETATAYVRLAEQWLPDEEIGVIKSLYANPRRPVPLLRTQKVRPKINKKTHGPAAKSPPRGADRPTRDGVIDSLTAVRAKTGPAVTGSFFARAPNFELPNLITCCPPKAAHLASITSGPSAE